MRMQIGRVIKRTSAALAISAAAIALLGPTGAQAGFGMGGGMSFLGRGGMHSFGGHGMHMNGASRMIAGHRSIGGMGRHSFGPMHGSKMSRYANSSGPK